MRFNPSTMRPRFVNVFFHINCFPKSISQHAAKLLKHTNKDGTANDGIPITWMWRGKYDTARLHILLMISECKLEFNQKVWFREGVTEMGQGMEGWRESEYKLGRWKDRGMEVERSSMGSRESESRGIVSRHLKNRRRQEASGRRREGYMGPLYIIIRPLCRHP